MNRMNPFRAVLFFLCLAGLLPLCLALPAAAQHPPDAGLLLQEERQKAPALPDRLPAGPKEEAGAPPLTDSGAKVFVKGFRFTGAAGLATEAELQEVVRPYLNRELGFAELGQAARAVTNYLQDKKGYLLARAYLPRQDVTAGVIEIAVISGRIDGKVEIRVREPSRIEKSLLEGIAARALPAGSPARMERIERAVLLMSDLPGMAANATLETGSAPGTTRVVVNAAEGPLFHGVLTGDNFGDRYTGAYRAGLQASASDPFGFADQVTLAYTGAENLNNWRAAYALPLGATGVMWNTSYTGLNYKLGKELEALNAKGWATDFITGFTYPLVRSRQASVWIGAGFEYTLLSDEAGGVKTRDRRLPLGTASVTGSFFDGFGGGGLTSAAVVATGGNVNLNDLAVNKLYDDAGPRTAGDFMRGTYSVARLQRVTGQLSLLGSVRGQVASGNLDSSQKFILGGSTGVRAYPTGEAPADEGHALTVEARYDLSFLPAWAAAQLVAFFDTGWVRLHNKPWPGAVASATGKNDYILSGGGVGINVGKAGLYSVRASYAHKIGTNDGRSANGNDSDNQSDDGRCWLQLIVWL